MKLFTHDLDVKITRNEITNALDDILKIRSSYEIRELDWLEAQRELGYALPEPYKYIVSLYAGICIEMFELTIPNAPPYFSRFKPIEVSNEPNEIQFGQLFDKEVLLWPNDGGLFQITKYHQNVCLMLNREANKQFSVNVVDFGDLNETVIDKFPVPFDIFFYCLINKLLPTNSDTAEVGPGYAVDSLYAIMGSDDSDGFIPMDSYGKRMEWFRKRFS